MKTLTPAQPGSRSRQLVVFLSVPPMKNAKSQYAMTRAGDLVGEPRRSWWSGYVGHFNTAVTPITAEREPVSRSSLWVRPGSRKCTWVSISPGSTCSPLQSIT